MGDQMVEATVSKWRGLWYDSRAEQLQTFNLRAPEDGIDGAKAKNQLSLGLAQWEKITKRSYTLSSMEMSKKWDKSHELGKEAEEQKRELKRNNKPRSLL